MATPAAPVRPKAAGACQHEHATAAVLVPPAVPSLEPATVCRAPISHEGTAPSWVAARAPAHHLPPLPAGIPGAAAGALAGESAATPAAAALAGSSTRAPPQPPAAAAVLLTWNQFQGQFKGRGMSKDEMSSAFRAYKATGRLPDMSHCKAQGVQQRKHGAAGMRHGTFRRLMHWGLGSRKDQQPLPQGEAAADGVAAGAAEAAFVVAAEAAAGPGSEAPSGVAAAGGLWHSPAAVEALPQAPGSATAPGVEYPMCMGAVAGGNAAASAAIGEVAPTEHCFVPYAGAAPVTADAEPSGALGNRTSSPLPAAVAGGDRADHNGPAAGGLLAEETSDVCGWSRPGSPAAGEESCLPSSSTTRDALEAAVLPAAAAAAAGSSAGTAPTAAAMAAVPVIKLTWNQFQQHCKGQGLSKEELSAAYKEHKVSGMLPCRGAAEPAATPAGAGGSGVGTGERGRIGRRQQQPSQKEQQQQPHHRRTSLRSWLGLGQQRGKSGRGGGNSSSRSGYNAGAPSVDAEVAPGLQVPAAVVAAATTQNGSASSAAAAASKEGSPALTSEQAVDATSVTTGAAATVSSASTMGWPRSDSTSQAMPFVTHGSQGLGSAERSAAGRLQREYLPHDLSGLLDDFGDWHSVTAESLKDLKRRIPARSGLYEWGAALPADDSPGGAAAGGGVGVGSRGLRPWTMEVVKAGAAGVDGSTHIVCFYLGKAGECVVVVANTGC